MLTKEVSALREEQNGQQAATKTAAKAAVGQLEQQVTQLSTTTQALQTQIRQVQQLQEAVKQENQCILEKKLEDHSRSQSKVEEELRGAMQ